MIMEELKEMKKEISNIKKIKEDITYMNLINLIKTLLILWFLSIVLIVGGFLLYLNQYEFIDEEINENYYQEADTEGDNSQIYQNIGGTING